MTSLENAIGTMSLREGKGSIPARLPHPDSHLAATWDAIKPVRYNYSVYNAATREERQAAEQKAAEEKADDEQFTGDVPLWASNAMKYEWDDEYGEVGPAHPELERQLFQGRYQMRSGEKLDV